MYLSSNIIEKTKISAEKFVLENDRELYLPFFVTTEKFCNQNNIIIGGKVGIDLLVGNSVTKDSWVWDLYCDDIFNTAKQLTDLLAATTSPHIPARTTGLSTDIKYIEYTIRINARTLFKLYSMDKYRGINLSIVMNPTIRSGYHTGLDIKCMSEEMQLIDIYRALYSPSKISTWDYYIRVESVIYNSISKILSDKIINQIDNKTGGKGNYIDIISLSKTIMDKIVKKSDYILIGDMAFEAFTGLSSDKRIQLISNKSIEDTVREIKSTLHSSNSKNVTINAVKFSLNLPNDFQLTKFTIYIKNSSSQFPIIDVFNSSKFEIIPYVKFPDQFDGYKIANLWVLLRFQFIDIWILRLMMNMNNESKNNNIFMRIKKIISSADKLHKIAATKLIENAQELFQLSNYVGIYVNETVAKKKLIKDIGERFPVYYPGGISR